MISLYYGIVKKEEMINIIELLTFLQGANVYVKY